MAVPVSDSVVANLITVNYFLFYILLLLPGMLLLVCCFPCCCILFKEEVKTKAFMDRLAFRATSCLCWFLRKTESHDVPRFIILGKLVAPLCYPYFLLVSTVIIVLHSVYAFAINSVVYKQSADINDYTEQLALQSTAMNSSLQSDDLGNDIGYYGDEFLIKCKKKDNCIEIHLLDGLNSALATFASSAFVFVLVTAVILIFSGGARWSKDDSSYCKCVRSICCSCVILIQVVGFLTPRVVYYFYFSKFESDFIKREDEVISRDGVFDRRSHIIICAGLDSIALAMLTPWYWFEPMESYDEEMSNVYNVNSA